jgi:hypothetical protein
MWGDEFASRGVKKPLKQALLPSGHRLAVNPPCFLHRTKGGVYMP